MLSIPQKWGSACGQRHRPLSSWSLLLPPTHVCAAGDGSRGVSLFFLAVSLALKCAFFIEKVTKAWQVVKEESGKWEKVE